MTYKQTLAYLYASLPMFQRIGDKAIRKDLTNIRHLCAMLGQPQNEFRSIHIAGTNGKGSTSHMLASIFQADGLKVGLYTSPHYMDFRERIKINGEMISEKEVVRFVKKYKDQWEQFRPSFFEITVAMAFDHFRNQKVGMAIIETGLGGRLDSTNIILPMLSVITNIGFDHTQMLGHTLEAIAVEKAGIIKRGVPIVIGEWNRKTAPVFKKKSTALKAPIHFASKHMRIATLTSSFHQHVVSAGFAKDSRWFARLVCDLGGPYQLKNLSTVLEAVWIWNTYYPENTIGKAAIRKGLSMVISSTNMIGRWMMIRDKPIVLTDAAHNEHGMKAMLPRLLSIPCKKRHFVLGFVSDKDIGNILSQFPEDGTYYWCAPDIPRGKASAETKVIGTAYGLRGSAYKNVILAYRAALKSASGQDLIFIGGSSYVVGDFLSGLKNKTDV